MFHVISEPLLWLPAKQNIGGREMGNGYKGVCVCVCVCAHKGELCTHSVCALVKTREGFAAA